MSYRLEYAESLAAKLATFPPQHLDAILGWLELLASDPVGLSAPARFPYPDRYQSFQFWVDGHLYTALFRYGADEETLHIYRIGHVHPAD